MPKLTGLATRGEQFPIIGSIHLGEPKSAHRPGAPLDYFRFTFDASVQDTAARRFLEIWPDGKPRAVRVLFHAPDLGTLWSRTNDVFDGSGRRLHSCECDSEGVTRVLREIDYTSGEVLVSGGKDKDGNAVYCDGTKVHYTYTGEDGKVVQVRCDTAYGRLKLWLPDLGVAGLCQLNTTTLHSILSIDEQLRAIETLQKDLGLSMQGVECTMSRVLREIRLTKKDGKRIKVKRWIVQILPTGRWMAGRSRGLFAQSLATPLLALKAGEDDDEIEGEFSEAQTIPAGAAVKASPVEPEQDDTGVLEFEPDERQQKMQDDNPPPNQQKDDQPDPLLTEAARLGAVLSPVTGPQPMTAQAFLIALGDKGISKGEAIRALGMGFEKWRETHNWTKPNTGYDKLFAEIVALLASPSA